jgi:ribosomal protein S18 acetylase RimI-like enzyme
MRATPSLVGSPCKHGLDALNAQKGCNAHDSHVECQQQRRDQREEDTPASTTNAQSRHEEEVVASRTVRFQSSNSITASFDSTQFYIRKARYMELGHVVEILIDSFYKPSDLVRPYLYLHELSRLQNNFPHNVLYSSRGNNGHTGGRALETQQPDHVFYVACTTCNVENSNAKVPTQQQQQQQRRRQYQETIVGFVEVDSRPGKKQNDPPRPYLSDLAVHRNYRRNGIARALIETCEKHVLEGWKERCLYLRVDRENYAARNMYMKLGYEWQPHDYFGHGRDTTMLLKKQWENVDDCFLKEEQDYGAFVNAQNGTNNDNISDEKGGNVEEHQFLLDYVI